MATVLEAKALSKTFGATKALQGVSFSLESGEVHAIVGENGAGKSTLVKILSGLIHPDEGELRLMGDAVSLAGAGDADAFGISVIHQELSLVPHLTVAQNLVLGQAPMHQNELGRRLHIVARRATIREAAEALSIMGAEISPDRAASSLSASQIQLVLIARALHRQMKILILDEPTSALSPVEREELFERLRALRQGNVGIIYISHHLDEVLELADRISILRDGKLVETREASSLTTNEIITLMLDRSLREMYPKVETDIGDPVLEVQGLASSAAPKGVDLVVRRGEIVGLTGLVGAGKTEVARAIIGADHPTAGAVRVAGKATLIRTPADAIRAGVVLVPENRATQGLIHTLSVRDNIAVQVMTHDETRRSVTKAHLIIWPRMTELARRAIEQLQIRVQTPLQNVRRLSGGNQQKVVLGKAFSTSPQVVILDEPTRGIDVGSKVEVYKTIQSLTRVGTGVLLVSSEIEEIVGMCDRVLIMRRGEVVAQYDRADISRELVLRHAAVANGASSV